MKSKNPNNPNCSRTLEGFREFLKNYKPVSPEEDKLLQETLKVLSRQTSSNALRKADKETDYKKYNSQSLDHSKISREIYKHPVFKDLSSPACKILIFVISSISQDSWIAFTQISLCELLGMSKPTVNKAIQELLNHEILKCVVKGKSPRLQESSIYELNAEWGTVGKQAIKKLKPEWQSDFNLVECKRIVETFNDYDDKPLQFTVRYNELRLT